MATQIAPKFVLEFSPSARWNAPVRWKYNHANAPVLLAANKAAIITQLQASFDKWTTPCAIQYVYDGETTTAPNTLNSGQPDGVSVVGCGPLDPALRAW